MAIINGSTGNDVLNGTAGNDEIYGGAGNDQIIGGLGDIMSGDAGNDKLTADFSSVTSDIAFNFLQQGLAPLTIVPGTTIQGFETFDLIFGSGNDTVDLDDAVFGGDESQFYSSSFNAGSGFDTVIVTETSFFWSNTYFTGFERFVGDFSALAGSVTVSPTFFQLPWFYTYIIGSFSTMSVTGSDGNDSLTGSAGNDYIDGRGGSDTINGGAGNDQIVGGLGDILSGDAGNDKLTADFSSVTSDITFSFLQQGLGPLTIVPGTTIQGFETFDLTFGSGNDTVDLDEALFGGDESQFYSSSFDAGAGFDTLIVTETSFFWSNTYFTGFERFVGDFSALAGSVTVSSTFFQLPWFYTYIRGEFSTMSVTGSAGNDSLAGSAGNDDIEGGAGNDRIYVSLGTDLLAGEAGTDVLDFSRIASDSSANLAAGTASSVAGVTATVATFENILGSAYNDVFNGNGGDNRLEGAAGNDQLFGSSGNDTLLGGDGNDLLSGGAGNDTLEGGNNDDTFAISTGTDTVDAAGGFDKLDFNGLTIAGVTVAMDTGAFTGFGANLTFTSIERVGGTSGNDTITGRTADSDTLQGMSGDDTLIGGGSSDSLFGGVGNDTLVGGTGNDALTGAAGFDTFQFAFGDGQDSMKDFDIADDTFAFEAATFGLTTASSITDFVRIGTGSPVPTHGYFQVNTTNISWDADGAGGVAAVRLVTYGTLNGLTHADFIFV